MRYKQIAAMTIPLTMMSDVKNVKAFVRGQIRILLSHDKTPKWGWLRHMSISCEFRYPTWEEILHAKEHFFGDEDCMMIMPKKKDYVNVHPNCFHVWQTPQEWGIQ